MPDPTPDLPVDPDLPVAADLVDAPPRPHIPWDIAAVIAAGGAVGGAARWGVNHVLPTSAGHLPWGTFTENVLGCLLLGGLMVFLLEVWRPRRYTRPFWGVGVLGGFTTFSTYTADTAELLRSGQGALALGYLFGTLAAGLTATWIGLTVVRILVVRPRAEARRAR